MGKNTTKKIVFLTSTRADFGKIKSLLSVLQGRGDFEAHVFVTGMHLNEKYGMTVEEIENFGVKNIYKYNNASKTPALDTLLASTISGFGKYINDLSPHMIIVHGDRVEALAGALVGSLNNILVAILKEVKFPVRLMIF